MKITENIKEFIARDIYKKSDILNVVHLADTDGAYIDDDLILEKQIDSIECDTENIYTKNVGSIKKKGINKNHKY